LNDNAVIVVEVDVATPNVIEVDDNVNAVVPAGLKTMDLPEPDDIVKFVEVFDDVIVGVEVDPNVKLPPLMVTPELAVSEVADNVELHVVAWCNVIEPVVAVNVVVFPVVKVRVFVAPSILILVLGLPVEVPPAPSKIAFGEMRNPQVVELHDANVKVSVSPALPA